MPACNSRPKRRAGWPITNNPFLNFLRVVYKGNRKWPYAKVLCEGAKVWRSLSCSQRNLYRPTPCQLQKIRQRRQRQKAAREKLIQMQAKQLLAAQKACKKPATGTKKTCKCKPKPKRKARKSCKCKSSQKKSSKQTC